MRALLASLATLACAVAADPAPAPAKDRFAPALEPKLLMVTRVGGSGDQWFPAVQVRGNKVMAGGDGTLGASVTVEDDDSVRGAISGVREDRHEPKTNLPNGGKVGGVSFGYNQVDPLLQLPFMKGPGWQLWGWNLQQAKTAKARYAPLMADSRIRSVTVGPNGEMFVVGTCDGGNTSLRAHPADIDVTLEFPIGHAQTGGGGGGRSSFCFAISPNGRLLRQMVCRGLVLDVAWDAWGRTYVAGQGVLKGDYTGGFGYPDGGGLLIADAAWERMLFGTHFGPNDKGGAFLWSVSIDSKSGIGAVSGFIEGNDLKGVNALQEKAGGGKDAFLAVFRLWPATAYDASKQAEKDAKEAERAAKQAEKDKAAEAKKTETAKPTAPPTP